MEEILKKIETLNKNWKSYLILIKHLLLIFKNYT